MLVLLKWMASTPQNIKGLASPFIGLCYDECGTQRNIFSFSQQIYKYIYMYVYSPSIIQVNMTE